VKILLDSPDTPVRLADFILANREPILQKWEDFAKTILPEGHMDRRELRDHADQMLTSIAADLRTAQTEQEQALKSKGLGPHSKNDSAAEIHAQDRLESGFSMEQMISEYRALRASVLSLWSHEIKTGIAFEIEDMTRFNEAIDQMLAESVGRYSNSVDQANNLFLAILGHDLRTPLGAIGLGAEIMLRSKEIGSKYTKISTRIFHSSRRAGKIVEDLLDFTRANSSAGLSVKPTPTNLKDICEGIIEELRIYHPERTILFVAEGQFDGNFDATRIEQAFCNLVDNAAKHGAIDSVVSIEMKNEQLSALLSVHNSGLPIDADDLPHIFDLMTRYSKFAADEEGPTSGLGLGLYIAHQIVTAHNGKVEVISNADQGTTFFIRLPLKVQ
jgi:signal transduction histidine kinase